MDGRFCITQFSQYVSGSLDKVLPLAGEVQAAGVSFHKTHLKPVFEGCQIARCSGVGQTQCLCRCAQAASFGDFNEQSQLSETVHCFSFRKSKLRKNYFKNIDEIIKSVPLTIQYPQ